mgnify:CR=1 FL=1
MKRRVRITVLGLALLLVFVGCQSQDSNQAILDPTVTPIPFTVIQPTPTSPEATDDEEAVIPAPTLEATPLPDLPAPDGVLNVPQVGGELGKIWNLSDLRYGLHADHMRLVLEMQESGATAPKYRVVEVSNAEAPFPGDADVSWGKARIDVMVSDLYARDFQLAETLPIEFADNPVITRIGQYPTADDALLGLSIGLREPANYQVYELGDPVRIVVDVFYP